MRYFLDTEFNDRTEPGSGRSVVELISVGIVAEDGREYYAEVAGFDWSRGEDELDPWLAVNVLPHLLGGVFEETAAQIALDLADLTGGDARPEFWAYVASYDWTCLMSLFGPLRSRPPRWPMAVHDLRQVMAGAGLSKQDLPAIAGTAHNALDDARWVRDSVGLLLPAAGASPPAGDPARVPGAADQAPMQPGRAPEPIADSCDPGRDGGSTYGEHEQAMLEALRDIEDEGRPAQPEPDRGQPDPSPEAVPEPAAAPAEPAAPDADGAPDDPGQQPATRRKVHAAPSPMPTSWTMHAAATPGPDGPEYRAFGIHRGPAAALAAADVASEPIRVDVREDPDGGYEGWLGIADWQPRIIRRIATAFPADPDPSAQNGKGRLLLLDVQPAAAPAAQRDDDDDRYR